MTNNDGSHQLSTMAKKLARDIQFATDIGRDSPFDPFAHRDVTKLFSKRPDTSLSLGPYYGEKPTRHVACATAYARMPRKVTSLAQPITQATYFPELPSQVKNVYFPKAKRFSDASRPASTVLEEKKKPTKAANTPTSMNISKMLDDIFEEAQAATPQRKSSPKRAASAQPKSQLIADDIVKVPDWRNAPSFGVMTTRDGRCPNTKDRSPSREQSRPTSKQIIFPWETRSQSAASKKSFKGRADASKKTTIDSAQPTSPQVTDDNEKGAEMRIDWERKQQQFLARFGLGASSKRDLRRRRQKHIPGVSFQSVPGRNKAMPFHVPGKEIHDLSYNPKNELTTKTRHVTHVELGRQADRFPRPSDSTAQDALKLSHLQEVFTDMRKRQRDQNIGLQSQQESANDPTSEVTRLTAKDELDYNTSTLRAPNAPLTRRFAGIPDMAMYCDRTVPSLENCTDGVKVKSKASSLSPRHNVRFHSSY